MQINPISSSSSRGNELFNSSSIATTPNSNDVRSFNSSMQAANGSEKCSDGNTQQKDSQDTDQLLQQILQILQLLLKSINNQPGAGADAEKPRGGSISDNGNGVQPVQGGGKGGSSGADQLIPPPSEHIQQLNLGGKPVTVGGDGSSSASEVAATASNIENLYNNSSTFRNMIDTSSDPSFEVSVGRRSDNTSWGNTEGRVFMNINNIAPTNSDNFQSLLGHEFAHASIDLGHGGQMEQVQQAVAQEA
ncbi:MAG: hypothetical protein R3F02_05185 [Thiolinea sp.]